MGRFFFFLFRLRSQLWRLSAMHHAIPGVRVFEGETDRKWHDSDEVLPHFVFFPSVSLGDSTGDVRFF